jgi:hypothetical protein|tara:strand:+ start:135 stop:797 length:663 start_codon:yes stop_codon:yes gene_type:complete
MEAWSYSKANTFKQCPKKYYHLKVAKDVVDRPSAAMAYGTRVHRAAENYIKNDTELETEYEFLRPVLDAFNNIEGEKYCELRLGVAKHKGDYYPTKFFGKDVWYRGVADLLIVNGDKAYLVDYKTGKSIDYADTTQLDLMAGAVFVNFPEVKVIKSALSFVVCNGFIKKEHTVDMYESYLSVFDEVLDRIEVAHDTGVWNAVEGGLCGFCPVTSCEHNRR